MLCAWHTCSSLHWDLHRSRLPRSRSSCYISKTTIVDTRMIPAHSEHMGQKTFKRLRKLARQMSELGHSGTKSLPESYMQSGRRTLNPGKPKGAYRWLKKNAHLAKKKSGR